MRHRILNLLLTLLTLAAFTSCISSNDEKTNLPSEADLKKSIEETEPEVSQSYTYPEFYKGIYLNVVSGRNMEKLQYFVKMAKESGINTFVIDVQTSKSNTCAVPAENVSYLLENGIHPIARIVCFDQGLSSLPVSQSRLDRIYALAESSASRGFKELQFDYIRFADKEYTSVNGVKRKIKPEEKYEFIDNLLSTAHERVNSYDVKIAADIFGRIPWQPANMHDTIGQKVEKLDEVVDVICPMAYPSHYWYDKATDTNYRYTPYKTVYKTSKMAREKTKKAAIVSYIQSFKMKMPSNMSYNQYIKEQIRACHDAEIRGFIMWNARQVYTVPFKAVKEYYSQSTTEAASL